LNDFKDYIAANTIEVNTLRTSRIELVDDDAKVRMKLYIAQDDTPVVALMDAEGRGRAFLTLSGESHGQMYFCDKDGRSQFCVEVAECGEPMIRMFSAEHKLALSAYVEDGRPCIWMFDRTERDRFSMFLEPNGKPYIMMRNADEESQTKITVSDDGSECFILEDREGEEVRIPLRAPREL